MHWAMAPALPVSAYLVGCGVLSSFDPQKTHEKPAIWKLRK